LPRRKVGFNALRQLLFCLWLPSSGPILFKLNLLTFFASFNSSGTSAAVVGHNKKNGLLFPEIQ